MTDNSHQNDPDHFYFDDTSFIFTKNEEAEQTRKRINRISCVVILISIILCSLIGFAIAVALP